MAARSHLRLETAINQTQKIDLSNKIFNLIWQMMSHALTQLVDTNIHFIGWQKLLRTLTSKSKSVMKEQEDLRRVMLGKIVFIPLLASSLNISPVPSLTITSSTERTPAFVMNGKGIVYRITDDTQLKFDVNISGLRFFLDLTITF